MSEYTDGSRERVALDLCITLKADLSVQNGKEHIDQVLKLYAACRRAVLTGTFDLSGIT